MPATETKVLVEFSLDKETKNAVRYTEVTTEDRGKIGSIYLLKEVAESLGSPERILVSVEAA
jgi:hypothetical protein